MALEGANVIGSFPVYNTSGNIALYNQILQKQQAQRQAEQQALQSELGKVKIDGLRDADKPEFFNKYDEWKNTFAKLSTERNPRRKVELRSEFDRKALELADFGDKSRQYNKAYTDFKSRLLDDNFRDQFADDAITKVQQADKVSINDPNFISDFTTLGRQVDLSKFNKELEGLNKTLLDSSRWRQNRVSGTEGNKTGVYVEDYRQVDPKQQALTYANNYDISPKFRTALRTMYPDLAANLSPEEFKAAAVQQLVKDHPVQEYGKKNFQADWKPEKESNNGFGSTESERKSIQRQQWINDMFDQVPGSGEKIKAIVEGSTNFGGQKLSISKNGDNFTFTIPSFKTYKPLQDGEEVAEVKAEFPKRQITINVRNAQDKVKLNQFLNEVTDEKINISQLLTEGGSKKISGNQESRDINRGSKNNQNTESKMVTFIMPDGRTGQIPANQAAAFQKKYPKAKRR